MEYQKVYIAFSFRSVASSVWKTAPNLLHRVYYYLSPWLADYFSVRLTINVSSLSVYQSVYRSVSLSDLKPGAFSRQIVGRFSWLLVRNICGVYQSTCLCDLEPEYFPDKIVGMFSRLMVGNICGVCPALRALRPFGFLNRILESDE